MNRRLKNATVLTVAVTLNSGSKGPRLTVDQLFMKLFFNKYL